MPKLLKRVYDASTALFKYFNLISVPMWFLKLKLIKSEMKKKITWRHMWTIISLIFLLQKTFLSKRNYFLSLQQLYFS